MTDSRQSRGSPTDGEPAAARNAPRPRDAASLIFYRVVNDELAVLLGRRAPESKFMPDVFVFPGGAVDAGDHKIVPATPLAEDIVPNLGVTRRPARARSLAIAAVRESCEESGLMLGRPGSIGAAAAATGIWEQFTDNGLAPDLAALSYLGRAITPTHRRRRFHARFFTCNADAHADLAGQPLRSNGELLDLDWFSYSNLETMPLRNVTRYMLDVLQTLIGRSESDRASSATAKPLQASLRLPTQNIVYTQRTGQLRIQNALGD